MRSPIFFANGTRVPPLQYQRTRRPRFCPFASSAFLRVLCASALSSLFFSRTHRSRPFLLYSLLPNFRLPPPTSTFLPLAYPLCTIGPRNPLRDSLFTAA